MDGCVVWSDRAAWIDGSGLVIAGGSLGKDVSGSNVVGYDVSYLEALCKAQGIFKSLKFTILWEN